MEQLRTWLTNPYGRAVAIFVVGLIGSWIVAFAIERILKVMVGRTKTDLDDKLIDAIHKPIVQTVVVLALGFAQHEVPMPDKLHGYTLSALKSATILIWVRAGFHVWSLLLEGLSRRSKQGSVVTTQTRPVFEMVGKILVVGAAVYFLFLAWNIDVTAWLASAGIVGIAVGFAAKDTLANFFSGIFIVADAPYKIGDFIVLDGGARGQVIAIGIRSTRILTRDDIEITIPNAVIGNSMIMNEAGGPQIHQRVRVEVDAAYGSDIDQVYEVLLEAAAIEGIEKSPAPVVRFEVFGASGLTHGIYVWIADAADRDRIKHELNTAIYKAFAAADIEIPYSKLDVYLKELPDGSNELRIAG
jgi:small-conductance mechanosensitive channel